MAGVEGQFPEILLFSVFFVRNLLIICLCSIALFAQAQATNPRVWLRFKVTQNGVYRISLNDLKKAGIDPGSIDLSQVHIYAYPTGMLPQPNSTPRPDGNVEVAVSVVGEDIFFYGEGPDRYSYVSPKAIFEYENNIYTDANYYFLVVDATPGLRMQKSGLTAGSRPVVNEYVDFGYYETDQYNDLKSGREWFGEQFDSRTEVTIRFAVPGIVENSDIRLVTNLMNQSYKPGRFKVSWNNNQVLDIQADTIPETTYGSKGRINIDSLTFNANSVGAPSVTNQDIKINFTKGSGNRSVGYLNYILFTINRKIAMYNAPTFINVPSNANAESDIEIASFKSGSTVWDVSDPFNAVEMNVASSGDIGKFASSTSSNRRFVVFASGDIKTPEFVESVAPQNLRAMTTPNLLIVAHPDFLTEANRLAAYRTSTYGISVKVVTPQQIYNEYSGGRQDVTAIRDFVRSLYLKTPNTLKSLLLFGRGSYDYKDRVFNNSNYVPIYQSRNSLDPLLTYSSDDYYGFLEDSEGLWSESINGNHTLDIGVGRIPVSSADHAKIIVDKLIAYDTKMDQSLWKQRILFVADDGDSNLHQSQAETLAESFETTYKGYQTSKIYLDAFEQNTVPSGQLSPKAKEALALELNRGYEIVNYIGHGSERIWMQERILDQDTPLGMRNSTRLPLFVTATCEFGRHDDPLLPSTAELLMTTKNRGAIGLVTTARPVNAYTNSVLNRAFYNAYFAASTSIKDIGSVFSQTKNNSASGVANRNFILLGDPSMRFDNPKETAVITSIQTSDGSGVLKALTKVTVAGEIQMNNVISTSFNGSIDIELYDKRTQHMTLGDENAPYPYKLWDHSLFRGKAKVVDGEFVVEFVVPEGVSDEIENGKFMMYAHTYDRFRDASGSKTNIEIGGTDLTASADNIGPSIELFMGDSTFVNGGYTNSDTYLVGKLYDKSGMNISGYGNGSMVAILDGNTTFAVNDYFIANEDDFTTGTFSYPLSNLAEGQHTISFTAADTYGNPGTATITFIVGADGALVVEDLYAYPNPFSESTPATIEFRHNRAGEDLEVQVVIYDVLGQPADKREFTVNSSTYKVTLFDWNGSSPFGTKMGNGVYLVKVVVRSVSDGAKNDKIARLILTN